MTRLSLALLGPFTVLYEDQPLIHFRTKAVQALLIYLVCQPEAHAREALTALLWPDLLPKSAQSNMRYTLYHLRQAIPTVAGASAEDVPFLLADRQTIQVNPDGRFQLDLTQFETLTDSPDVADWTAAVSLYRGDFLSNFYLPDSPEFESWAQSRRTDLRRRLLDTLTNLTDHYLDEGEWEQAEQYARQQLAVDNLREEAHRQLMTVLARNGHRTDALTHYQDLCQLLQEELGIIPSTETEILVAAIRSDSLAEKVKSQGQEVKIDTSYPVPHNLPLQATPFIGRQTELAELDDLLADSQTRLITILGQGGMGKTRLSLAVAERQLAGRAFANGIFFVALAGLSESERIVSAIAEAMRLRLEKGESQLLSYLKAKKILLVLDNFEHLLDGSDLVRRLLHAAPQLQILVTSRERLRLQGEQVYPIQGLVMDETAVTDDARTLFLQAAHRLRPDFEVTGETLPTLNKICRLVEGMPLALELAAVWVDMFTLADIAAEIQRNLDFLESNLRDMPSRHRSMQAVFDTSWQQLPDKLQAVLAAIGVFRGGFTREAATAVAKASLHDLATLVNKSLISFDTTANRYQIHELLRQYSLARLEETAVQDRHATYYLDWLVQQAPKLNGAEQTTTIALIEREMDNIRVAINWAIEIQRYDNFVPVIRALGKFYKIQPHPIEPITLYEHVYKRLSAMSNTSLRILYWLIAFQVDKLGGLGYRTKARQLWQEGKSYLVDLASQDEDIRAERSFAAYIEGFDLYLEQPAEARRLFQQSYELLMEIGDRLVAGAASLAMGRAARNEGDLAAAEAATLRSLSLFQEQQNKIMIVYAQITLGELAGFDGRYEEAEQQLSTAIVIARQERQFLLRAALSSLQTVYLFSGQFQKAKVPLHENRLLNEEAGFSWEMMQNDMVFSLVHLHGDGQYSEAQDIGQKVLQIGREMGQNLFISEPLVLLAQVDIVLGNYAPAQARLDECVELSTRAVGSKLYIAGNDLYWGVLKAATGETAVARQHLHAELETAVQRQDKLNLANALAAIALLYGLENEATAALETYTLAQQHPFIANSVWFAKVVGERITAVAQTLSPEAVAAAQARGSALDMRETAEHILLEIAH